MKVKKYKQMYESLSYISQVKQFRDKLQSEYFNDFQYNNEDFTIEIIIKNSKRKDVLDIPLTPENYELVEQVLDNLIKNDEDYELDKDVDKYNI